MLRRSVGLLKIVDENLPKLGSVLYYVAKLGGEPPPLAEIHFFRIRPKFITIKACGIMLIAPQSMPVNCEMFLNRSATESVTKYNNLVKKWISARGGGSSPIFFLQSTKNT